MIREQQEIYGDAPTREKCFLGGRGLNTVYRAGEDSAYSVCKGFFACRQALQAPALSQIPITMPHFAFPQQDPEDTPSPGAEIWWYAARSSPPEVTPVDVHPVPRPHCCPSIISTCGTLFEDLFFGKAGGFNRNVDAGRPLINATHVPRNLKFPSSIRCRNLTSTMGTRFFLPRVAWSANPRDAINTKGPKSAANPPPRSLSLFYAFLTDHLTHLTSPRLFSSHSSLHKCAFCL